MKSGAFIAVSAGSDFEIERTVDSGWLGDEVSEREDVVYLSSSVKQILASFSAMFCGLY